MPKLINNAILNLRVELEVTPDWWSRHGGAEMHPAAPKSADLIASAMLASMRVFEICEIRVSRGRLLIVTRINEGETFADLSEKVGRLVEVLNGLAL